MFSFDTLTLLIFFSKFNENIPPFVFLLTAKSDVYFRYGENFHFLKNSHYLRKSYDDQLIINFATSCGYLISFDVMQDERDRATVIHQRLERRWLGSIKVPFSTIYFNGKIDGTFRLNAPPVSQTTSLSLPDA